MDEQTNLVKYVDPFTILAINPKGALRRIYTPFRVLCIHPAGTIPKDAWVFVDGVTQDQTDRLLYLVGGKLYLHSFFKLHVLF
jgi:hypothetical protein